MLLCTKDPKWPAAFPFGAAELARYDEAKDTEFYSKVRCALRPSSSDD
jgi:hypothetical protein